MKRMRYNSILVSLFEMSEHSYCDSEYVVSIPFRLPIRMYMALSGVSCNEALNCKRVVNSQIGAEIGERLRTTMNRWKAEGLDIEAEKVDYHTLKQSDVFGEYLELVGVLQNFDPATLTTDDERKAFWINIYNVMMIHGVVAYRVKKSVLEIRGTFERIAYLIGGLRYSLDDIENGILRNNRAHVAIPGVRFVEEDPRRQFVLEQFDPRIHFALVCASGSCPPIGIYQAENIDPQLELATRNFINNGSVVLNKDEMSVSLSRIFQWYSSDFGGRWMGLGNKSPILHYIVRYISDESDAEFISKHAKNLKVSYQKYDWSLNV